MDQFKNKVVLVTGGTRGMGLVTAEYFMKEGAFVYISGRNAEKGKSIEKEMKKNGDNIHFIRCEISDSNDIKAMIDEIEKKSGRLDCAFNNAGITSAYAPIDESDEKNWEDVININLNGTYYCMKHELRLMLKNNSGVIINNASVAGIIAFPYQAAYVASKTAVIALTKSAAIEYGQKGIRINALACGPIMGGMNTEEKLKANPERTKKKLDYTAMHRFGQPGEVAEAVLFLCSEKAGYITGTVLPVDGGIHIGKWH